MNKVVNTSVKDFSEETMDYLVPGMGFEDVTLPEGHWLKDNARFIEFVRLYLLSGDEKNQRDILVDQARKSVMA